MACSKAALSMKKRTQLFRAIPEAILDKSAPIWHPVGSLQVQRAPTTPAARDAEPGSSAKQKLGPPPLPSFGARQEGRHRCGVRRPRHGEGLIVGAYPFSRRTNSSGLSQISGVDG